MPSSIWPWLLLAAGIFLSGGSRVTEEDGTQAGSTGDPVGTARKAAARIGPTERALRLITSDSLEVKSWGAKGGVLYIAPAGYSVKDKDIVRALALVTHRELGVRTYARQNDGEDMYTMGDGPLSRGEPRKIPSGILGGDDNG